MMRIPRIAAAFCMLLFFTGVFSPLGAENYLARTMTVHIMVADPDATGDRLAGWAVDRGGYYTYKSAQRIVLRIPQQDMEDLRRLVEKEAEEVVSEYFQAQDLRETIVAVRSGMVSRDEILQKNLAYIDKTDVEGTLAIEREIAGLIGEIEQLKGRLRKLVNDTAYARAEIQLSFMEKTLPHDIASSFKWINQIDFYLFMGGGVR